MSHPKIFDEGNYESSRIFEGEGEAGKVEPSRKK
jgi:hypothetical protein